MKKLIYLLPVLFIASCKADSAFGGGLWFIPLVTGLGALFSFGKCAYLYNKNKTMQAGALVFGTILTLFTIGAIIYMLHDK